MTEATTHRPLQRRPRRMGPPRDAIGVGDAAAARGGELEAVGHPRSTLDPDRLERVLIDTAANGRIVSYRQLLAVFGRRVGPNNVRALMQVLAEVCRRSAARAEPELACIVVREADGLPGEGYFRGTPGEFDRMRRASMVAAAQARAFAHWRQGLAVPGDERSLSPSPDEEGRPCG